VLINFRNKGEKEMQLQQLLSYLPIYQMIGEGNPDITSIEQNHKQVSKGSLFICIKGEKFDGHLFAEEAIKNGAVAIISEKDLHLSVPVIVVNDSKRVMAIVASAFYNHPSHHLMVIGVTGTNGKTSTSHYINSMLQYAGKKTGLIGTMYTKINHEVFETKNTTPDSLTLQKTFHEMLVKQVDTAIMEVSSHALHQGRVWGTDFNIAVFTNLTQDHLDYHKTMDEYKRAKSLLFSQLGNTYNDFSGKFAVLNSDEEASELFAQSTAAHVISYGIHGNADIRATNIEVNGNGSSFDLVTPSGTISIQTKLIGLFNIYNLLAAASVGWIMKLSLKEIREAFSTLEGVPGRFELVDEKQPFPVIVDYAHTPDGLENVLNTVRELANRRVFVVIGCGGDRDKSKRPKMAEIACRLATDAIFTSDNPRSEDPEQIIEDMLKGIKGNNYKVILDRKEAIKYAIMEANDGDVVLIAGKGHETYQIIGDQVLPFDDRKIAADVIKERL